MTDNHKKHFELQLLSDGLRRQPELRDEVHAAIVEALRPYERDGRLVLQASTLIASAAA